MIDGTTVIASVRARWDTGTAPPDRRTGSVAAPPTGHVPAEYLPLYTCLERRCASAVVLTFEQMEALPERTARPNFRARYMTFERQP